MKEVSADKAYLGAENLLTTLRRARSLHSIQVKFGAGFSRELWTKVRTLDAHVSFYSLHRAEFLQHYHKPVKHRNNIPHDQGEVWAATAKQITSGADQRGTVQGALL